MRLEMYFSYAKMKRWKSMRERKKFCSEKKVEKKLKLKLFKKRNQGKG